MTDLTEPTYILTLDQSNCQHRFVKEAQWIFEGAAIKRLRCVDCGLKFFYVDPVAKQSDYNWQPQNPLVPQEIPTVTIKKGKGK